MVDLETDYLVIGAGASGLSFVDALITADPEVEVVVVDRRHGAGGHWVDAYPFVRLHQPSAYYGVNSVPLGEDRIDTDGINAGFYERASAAELVRYYERVMEHLAATGRVRFLLGHEYQGSEHGRHIVRSTISGSPTTLAPRRRFVDATYVESVIPSRHTPTFGIDDGVRFVTPNDLPALDEPAGGLVILGGGKTAMDVCVWLLEHGVDPDQIQWVRPRDGWFVDRTYTQPHDLVANMLDMQSRSVEAAALATSGSDFARRLEAHGMMFRLDPDCEPEIYRGATLARAERDALQTIERVVRLGRVRSISATEIDFDGGTMPIGGDTVVVDCTAQGLATSVTKPIFDGGQMTVQFTTLGVAPWSAAILGFVESLDVDDAERNRLCPAVPRTGLIADQLSVYHVGFQAEGARRDHPDIGAWAATSRLNPMRSLAAHASDDVVQPMFMRMFEHYEQAMANLARHAH
ncbi:MAG: hypothetical protein AAGA37_00150 [Actinomycetota bacterium]